MTLYGWNLNQLRITAFCTQGSALFNSPYDSFLEFAHIQPLNVDAKPTAKHFELEGEFEGRSLKILIRNDRVDFVFLPLLNEPTEVKQTEQIFLPSLSPSDTFRIDAIEKVLEFIDSKPVKLDRLAFGCKLVKTFNELVELYKSYSPLLPFEINPDTDTDVVLQINRPREVHGFKYNTLTKTSAERLVAEYTLDEKFTKKLQAFILSLDFDINTFPEADTALSSLRSDGRGVKYSNIISSFVDFAEKHIESPFKEFVKP